jgi:hypothetical protein
VLAKHRHQTAEMATTINKVLLSAMSYLHLPTVHVRNRPAPCMHVLATNCTHWYPWTHQHGTTICLL